MASVLFRCLTQVVIFGLVAGVTSIAYSQPPVPYQLETDWLIDSNGFTAEVKVDEARQLIVLQNGLVSRTFRFGSEGLSDAEPNAKGLATIGFRNLATGQSLIRAVRPEGSVTIDGKQYDIGGMSGQANHAFLRPQDIDTMEFSEQGLRFVNYEVSKPKAPFEWKRRRHAAPNSKWPPDGVALRLDFEPRSSSANSFRVSVHYEMYDGIPLIVKWLTVENLAREPLTVDRFTAETLALVEHSNPVEAREGVPLAKPKMLHVETDMAFGGFKYESANRHTVHYREDPQYRTQVNYLRKSPCLLVVEPTYGPAQDLDTGETFSTFRVFELAHDSFDRERRGLAMRKMYRTVAPWTTENPLMHHMRTAEPTRVREAIDQAAEVGFEMIILSFGSGFNAENDSPEYLQQWKEIVAYAASKEIELGCYSLYSSRRIGNGQDIVPPDGQAITHGNCPAITSEWGRKYLAKLYRLFDETGFAVLEHDGPYPGDVDVTERLPYQKGVDDSRWVHWKTWTEFYQWLRSKGVYLNAPDYYFLAGSNKCGMGYREVNWSLPRAEQLLHTRQNIFDGTWDKTPSMGWMFVPLSEYHGGGAAATIEPLAEHIEHYEQMVLSNLAFGVQACYRGPRLFDSEAVKLMLQENVTWFKEYRDILESDVLHLRRADGQHLDGMIHVNPDLEDRAMLCVFNPTQEVREETWRVPLYYSGLSETATMYVEGANGQSIELDRFSRAQVKLKLSPGQFTWILFR